MSKEIKYVKISEERYLELLENEAWQEALSAAGVDNWDGIDYAIDIFEEYKEPKDLPYVV